MYQFEYKRGCYREKNHNHCVGSIYNCFISGGSVSIFSRLHFLFYKEKSR